MKTFKITFSTNTGGDEPCALQRGIWDAENSDMARDYFKAEMDNHHILGVREILADGSLGTLSR